MGRFRVLCLMYHRLCTADAYQHLQGTERMFTLPVEQFDRHISHLTGEGLTFLSPQEVEAFARGHLKLKRGGVMITFDDGCRSVGELAAPVLRSYGAKATLFVTTDPASYVFDLSPDDPRLTDEAIAALDGDTIQIESHSVTHQPLTGMRDSELRNELVGSRLHLEAVLHRDVGYFAIPGNWFDKRVIRLARNAGYRGLWCSNPGWVHCGSHGFPFPRVNIDGDVTLDGFRRQISPFGVVRRRVVMAVKRTPGRILGPRLWDPVRRAALACVPGGYLSMRRIGGACVVLVGILVFFLLIWKLR